MAGTGLDTTMALPRQFQARVRPVGDKIHQGAQGLAKIQGLGLMFGAVHFVRFENTQDQHYQNAIRVFGPPDFLHRSYDGRCLAEIMPGDTVIFGKGDAAQPVILYSFDDSAFR